MNISEKLFNVQLSLEKQKRGGFVGSGPSKPPFAPMRGVGEGEKSINCIKLYDVTGPLVTSWLLKKFLRTDWRQESF